MNQINETLRALRQTKETYQIKQNNYKQEKTRCTDTKKHQQLDKKIKNIEIKINRLDREIKKLL